MSELVTFGESMLRYSPPFDVRIETTERFDVRVAGAESNVAITASRLGTDAVWISKLPDSPLGRRVTSFLHAAGTETDVVWDEGGRQGTYYLEFAGEPRGTDVIYDREGSSVTTATAEELPTGRIEEADVFCTCGITPALSPTLRETTADLLSLAGDAGTTTAFDLNYRSKLWSPAEARETVTELFPAIDLFVTKLDDARDVLELDADGPTVASTLADEWGFETVVVTLGARGAIALHDGELVEQPAYQCETVDPIGTGDAFVGAFLARRIEGGDVASALEYGAATAALKRTIPGDVAIVTREEVERVVEGRHAELTR